MNFQSNLLFRKTSKCFKISAHYRIELGLSMQLKKVLQNNS